MPRLSTYFSARLCLRSKPGVKDKIIEMAMNSSGVRDAGRVLKVAYNTVLRTLKNLILSTSQTCPCCEHVSKDNRKTQVHFECVECGYTNNADIVGALNILERGHRLLACGESALAA
jgi:transposase-like protein